MGNDRRNPERKSRAIAPIGGAAPAIGRYLWMLHDTRRQTEQALVGLDPAVLDWSPLPAANTIGTLLYHIALVEADWLYEDALEQPLPVDVAALLPYDDRDRHGHLTVVTDRSLAEHLSLLAAIRERLIAAFGAMSLDDFYRLHARSRYDVSAEWCAYHLVEHEVEHRGEIRTVRLLAEAALGIATG
jgi:uncharacterized damage-inducible protein DinB